jgi:hypothetical protein
MNNSLSAHEAVTTENGALMPWQWQPHVALGAQPWHWHPDVAPGVNPAESLAFLRPVGPPPAAITPPWRRPPHQPEGEDYIALTHQAPGTVLLSQLSVPGTDVCEEERPAKRRRLIENPSQFRDIARFLDPRSSSISSSGHNLDRNAAEEEGEEGETEEEGDQGVSIEAPCPICGRQLRLPDAVMPDTSAYPDPETETETMAVLPCGHMIGAECLAQHLAYKDDLAFAELGIHDLGETLPRGSAFGYHDCPLCRFPLGHADCGHGLVPKLYDPAWGPRRGRQIPPTLPEGGRVSPACRACSLASYDAWVWESCANALPHLADHCYREPELYGPRQVAALREAAADMLWASVRLQVDALLDW